MDIERNWEKYSPARGIGTEEAKSKAVFLEVKHNKYRMGFFTGAVDELRNGATGVTLFYDKKSGKIGLNFVEEKTGETIKLNTKKRRICMGGFVDFYKLRNTVKPGSVYKLIPYNKEGISYTLYKVPQKKD